MHPEFHPRALPLYRRRRPTHLWIRSSLFKLSSKVPYDFEHLGVSWAWNSHEMHALRAGNRFSLSSTNSKMRTSKQVTLTSTSGMRISLGQPRQPWTAGLVFSVRPHQQCME